MAVAHVQLSSLPRRGQCKSVHNRCTRVCRSPRLVVLGEAGKPKERKTQVVLKRKVPGLGGAGTLADVNPGYFRNYLHPFGYAAKATNEVLAEIKAKQEKEEASRQKIKDTAVQLKTALATIGKFVIKKKAGESKQIFGSVTTAEVADLIKTQTSREVEKGDITLPSIKELGDYTVSVKLHPEVSAEFTLVVVAAPQS